MNVYDAMRELGEIAKKRSQIYNAGKVETSFAFGWFLADMQSNLDNMNLTKKQMKVLEDRIASMKRQMEAV